MRGRGVVFGLLVVLALAASGAVGTAHIQDLNLECVKPVYIIADDFNRDAYPDLAVACHSCNTVLVIPNVDGGMEPCKAFGGALSWTLDDSPVALASGYFIDPPVNPVNPPGWFFPFTSMFPNILVVTQYEPGLGRFSPLNANSAPAFLALQPGNVNKLDPLNQWFATLTHLTVGDFNNDGALDVAVLDGLTPQIGIYSGNRATPAAAVPPNGSVRGGPVFTQPIGANRAYFVATGDFDRDGLLDLVVAADGRLFFYRNTTNITAPGAAITFAPPAPTAANPTPTTDIVLGTKVVGIAVADFNRDGYLDLAAVDPEFGALSIVLNRGCWKFELLQRIKKDGEPVFVVPLDCDRNGLIDLAVAERATSRVEIVLNELICHETADGFKRPDPCDWTVPSPQYTAENIDHIQFFASHSYPVGPGPISLAVADFDLNGMPDIAVALSGGDGTTAPPPEVQIIYNPCCCRPCCEPSKPCEPPCCDQADSERGICPEKVGAAPKG